MHVMPICNTQNTRNTHKSQRTHTKHTATNLVLYDSIMAPEQFAAFVVAMFPHVPPVEAVGEWLTD